MAYAPSYLMQVVIIGLLLAVLGVVGMGAWWSAGGEGSPLHADTGNATLVALGGEVYATHCASCHGANLEGEPEWRTRNADGTLPAPPHDESGHTWHHPDQQLFDITKYGIEHFAPAGYRSNMPAFEDVLSDREIWAVLAYIKAQWPDETRRLQEARNRQ